MLATFLMAQPAGAQVPEAEVDFYVKSSEGDEPFTVGDQIELRLEIRHPVDSRVVLPQLEEQWQTFEVVDQTAPEIVDNEDGTATTGKDITVTVFRPGEFQTPKLVITHRKPDGSVEELAAPVIPIRITSVLTEDLTLRDLKPQAELPTPAIWPYVVTGLWLTMLLSGLLAGVGLLFYHYYWKERMASSSIPAPVIDLRPPAVIAHAELDRIEALDLPAQHRIKEHYSLVADCLRGYIEGLYHIPALEQTTSELRQAFRKAPVSMREVSSFMEILSESDLVKFARFKPPNDDTYGLVGRARTIVDMTTPEPEPDPMVTSEVEVAS